MYPTALNEFDTPGLNHVTLCIFQNGISSRFRKYHVEIKYFVTNNETEIF